MPKTYEARIQEGFTRQTDTLRVDRDQCLVRGLKFCGWSSAHGRDYDKVQYGRDAQKYHNAKVNIDHQPNPVSASFAARFGRCLNPEVREDGIYGDLKYNPEHPLAKTFAWFAENDPTAIGLSHNVVGRYEHTPDGRVRVIGISRVDSVDVVADPASTGGLFESMDENLGGEPGDLELPDAAPQEVPGSAVGEQLADLARAIFLDESVDVTKTALKLRKLADFLEEMQGAGIPVEDIAPEGTEELPPEEGEELPPEEDEEELMESKGGKLTSKERLELAELRLQESLRKEFEDRKAKALTRCRESKLPPAVVTDVFVELLASQTEETAVTRLLEDRKALLVNAFVKQPIAVGSGSPPSDTKAFVGELLKGVR